MVKITVDRSQNSLSEFSVNVDNIYTSLVKKNIFTRINKMTKKFMECYSYLTKRKKKRKWNILHILWHQIKEPSNEWAYISIADMFVVVSLNFGLWKYELQYHLVIMASIYMTRRSFKKPLLSKSLDDGRVSEFTLNKAASEAKSFSESNSFSCKRKKINK